MLARYYGFREDPFGASPDPRCLYESSTHREALASLKYGSSSNRGFIALIASPGMGKTTLLFHFLEDIRHSARTAFIFNIDPRCEPREIISLILRDLGIEPGHNHAEMQEQLRLAVVEEAKAGRRFVVVIDEAQNLSDAALEVVRMLSNFETPRAKLLQVVLAGQPQLAERLMEPSLLQLRQRISTFCRIDPFSVEQTKAYIEHRLSFVGYQGSSLFTSEALSRLADASHGVPRNINTLCFNALSLCCAMNRKQVDASMVAEAIADLQLVPAPTGATAALAAAIHEAEAVPSSRPEPRIRVTKRTLIWATAAACILTASVLGGLGISELRMHRSHQSADGNAAVATANSTTPPPPALPAPTLNTTPRAHVARTPAARPPVSRKQTAGQVTDHHAPSADLKPVQQAQDRQVVDNSSLHRLWAALAELPASLTPSDYTIQRLQSRLDILNNFATDALRSSNELALKTFRFLKQLVTQG